MDFNYTPEEKKFRKQVRVWLDKNRPRGASKLARDTSMADDEQWRRLVEWHRKLSGGGWVGLSWPKEYGGRGANLMEQIIFNQEMQRLKLPAGASP